MSDPPEHYQFKLFQDDRSKESTEFPDVFVDQAVRRWDAERENAVRLAARVNLLYSVVVALFGLGLFKIDWFRGGSDVVRVSPLWMIWTIKSCLLASLVLCGLAFLAIITDTTPNIPAQDDGDPARNPYSSERLRLTDDETIIGPMTLDAAKSLVYKRLCESADDLAARNAKKKMQISRGVFLLKIGLTFVFAAIVLYILSSEPRVWTPEATNAITTTQPKPATAPH